MPQTILIGSDNTVREAKNSYLLSYLANLTQRGLAKCAGLLNLRKSHTHDAVDQLWGVLARRVGNSDSFQTPEGVKNILLAELGRPGLKSWIGLQCEVSVSKLNAVHAWKTHFEAEQVGLSGGLKDDASANHCFLMMQRRGLLLPLLNSYILYSK